MTVAVRPTWTVNPGESRWNLFLWGIALNHSFNIDLAKQFGILEAVLLENIAHWIHKNQSMEKNFKDGRFWTYNSIRGFAIQFDYVSERQIRYALDSLVNKDVLIRSSFNKAGFDKTSWFSFSDTFMKSGGFPFDKIVKGVDTVVKGVDTVVRPIPNINTDINTDIKQRAAKPRSTSGMRTLKTYLEECKANKVKPISDEHPSRRYAKDVGIDNEMLAIMWHWFKEQYTEGTGQQKKYKDWGAAFANAVKGNWGKLWYMSKDTGEVCWSSQGLMFKASIDAKLGN